jgi:hypothetical protein
MEPGFVLDVGHNQNFPTRWAEGTPEKSFFKSLKVKGRKLDTVTFRCPKCGWLIWFAPEAGDPEP